MGPLNGTGKLKYRVKNWRTFQHYKDRNPPWIKLHFALLSSRDWVTLADASRVLAVVCMLVASRNDGEIDGSEAGLEYLQRVGYLKGKPILKPLIECGFLESASEMLAPSTKAIEPARPETETERLTEKNPVAALPEWLDAEKWQTYFASRPKKSRTPEALQGCIEKLEGFRAAGHDPNAIVAESIANGWQGLFAPKVNGAAKPIAQAATPTRSCTHCGKPAKTWVGDRCTPCWNSYMGIGANA